MRAQSLNKEEQKEVDKIKKKIQEIEFNMSKSHGEERKNLYKKRIKLDSQLRAFIYPAYINKYERKSE